MIKKKVVGYFLVIAIFTFFSGNLFAKTKITMLHVNAIPAVDQIWENARQSFNKKYSEYEVELRFLENEAFKAKLPTLLQSKARPDIFYSWGGGNFQQRVRDGLLKDITALSGNLVKKLPEGALNAYRYEGKLYGAPRDVSQVGFWYNKKLFAQAGVKAESIKTWDDFLNTVKKLKAAGITPIAAGGADKWPVHFYWSYLVMRIGGFKAFNDAMNSRGDGFKSPAFVKAGHEFKRLVDLKPFQKGFMAANYGKAAGYFGDYKAAMHLMGNWDISVHRDASVTKKGVVDADLGFLNFPAVKGGKGSATSTLGGITGWVVSKGASNGAVKWLEVLLDLETQKHEAAGGHVITVANGSAAYLKNPHLKQIAQNITNSDWHQVFFDQALGSDVGGVINNVSAELASGDITPEEAAERVQEAWEMR